MKDRLKTVCPGTRATCVHTSLVTASSHPHPLLPCALSNHVVSQSQGGGGVGAWQVPQLVCALGSEQHSFCDFPNWHT